MVIFHGSYTQIKQPEIIVGKYSKDFGQGFYCTELKEQAIRWARRYDTSFVNVYDYQSDENLNLNVLFFPQMTEEWLDFVVKSRMGEEHNYDIVTGPMANDQVYNYVSDYIDGILTREQFWVLAKFKHPTNQICFSNANALKYLTFLKSEQYGG